MKKNLLAFLITTLFTQAVFAVQTKSQEDDDKALEAGKSARSTCYISLFYRDKEEKPHFLSSGSGALIKAGSFAEPAIIMTAGHIINNRLDELPKKTSKKIRKNLKEGKPFSMLGYVTFESHVHETLSKYLESMRKEGGIIGDKFPKIYEIGSVIMHPSYDYEDGDSSTDMGLLTLKTPVKGILPLRLYEKGVIPFLGLHREYDPGMEKVVKAFFTGFGGDVSQIYGYRRTVLQLCFLEEDEEEDSDTEKSEDLKEDDKESFDITAYVPSKIKGGDVSEKKRAFHTALYKQKKKGEVYGLLHRGDSGGPLTVKDSKGIEYLIGVESTSGDTEGDQISLRDFRSAKKLWPDYSSYLCPLFTGEGELRPEIPNLLRTLKEAPVFPPSPDLDELVQAELKVLTLVDAFFSSAKIIEGAIHDMEALLRLKFDKEDSILEKFTEVKIKYTPKEDIKTEIDFSKGEKLEKLSIDLDKASELLSKEGIEGFKAEIEKKIKRLNEKRSEFQSFLAP